MLAHYIRRRDILDPRYRFRSAVTGQYVTRWYALFHPRETMKERA